MSTQLILLPVRQQPTLPLMVLSDTQPLFYQQMGKLLLGSGPLRPKCHMSELIDDGRIACYQVTMICQTEVQEKAIQTNDMQYNCKAYLCDVTSLLSNLLWK